ncbi:MAG TPA: hypothetical protein VJI98_02610 [Candidatus Nanoarchaeia archaeon]|nr:hypothetical protein [Candidatus Nanoarchaeia archaeon]
MDSKSKKWLVGIFLGVLLLRLILAFSNGGFTYESYFHLRQVESIKETGFPNYDDELSFGGRHYRFLPLFHYLIAFFSLFLPLEFAAKFIPNILISFLTVIAYLIAGKITRDKHAPLFSAFIVGLLPILFKTNSFTPETLFLPLIFLCIYSFLNIDRSKFQFIYVISFLLVSLVSSATFLLIIGFVIYLVLSFLEGKKTPNSELELILFSLVFFIWTQHLFFKNLLLEQGVRFIWQNIPVQIIQQYFPKLSLLQVILLVSIIPFLIGVYVVYRSLFKLKTTKSFLLISLVVSTSTLAWLRLIKIELSLAFFGISLALLFASFYEEIVQFIQRTKISHLQRKISVFVVIILFLSMIFPAVNTSISQDIPSLTDLLAFQWLKENVPENSTVAALLEEGHLITYYGQKKNIIDDQFGLVEDIESRFSDLGDIFTTTFHTHAVGLFDKYEINYIVFSERAEENFLFPNFQYITPECYERVYDEGLKIYKVKCGLGS